MLSMREGVYKRGSPDTYIMETFGGTAVSSAAVFRSQSAPSDEEGSYSTP